MRTTLPMGGLMLLLLTQGLRVQGQAMPMAPAPPPGGSAPAPAPPAPGPGSSAPGSSPSTPGSGPSTPGSGPSAPGSGPSAPGSGPSAPGSGPSTPGSGPSAPGSGPYAPGSGLYAPGFGPSAPAAQTPAAALPEIVPAPRGPAAGNRYTLSVNNAPIGPFLAELAGKERVALQFPQDLNLRFSLEASNAGFEEVLHMICDSQGLRVQKGRNGCWLVGLAEDFQAGFPGEEEPGQTQVAYRSRNLGPDSLAESLSAVFPALKCFPGPRFKSPALDGSGASMDSGMGGGMGGGGMAMGGGGMPMGGGGGAPMPMMGGGGMAMGGGGARPGADSRRLDVILVGAPAEVRRALAFARKLDLPRQQVRVNVRITELTETATKDLGIDWTFNGEAGGPPPISFSEVNGPSATSAGNRGLKLGSFSHSPAQIAFSLQFMETKGLVKTLANPSLLVMDGEKCSILIGERRLYPKQTGTNAQGVATFDVAEMKVGVMLQLAVQVGLNKDVTFSLYPQDSFASGTQNILGSDYPVIATREIQTTVHLKSGATLVVGGLKVDEDIHSTDGLPFLARLPLIGPLFGSVTKQKNNRELLIMVQPEILDEGGDSRSRITVLNG